MRNGCFGFGESCCYGLPHTVNWQLLKWIFRNWCFYWRHYLGWGLNFCLYSLLNLNRLLVPLNILLDYPSTWSWTWTHLWYIDTFFIGCHFSSRTSEHSVPTWWCCWLWWNWLTFGNWWRRLSWSWSRLRLLSWIWECIVLKLANIGFLSDTNTKDRANGKHLFICSQNLRKDSLFTSLKCDSGFVCLNITESITLSKFFSFLDFPLDNFALSHGGTQSRHSRLSIVDTWVGCAWDKFLFSFSPQALMVIIWVFRREGLQWKQFRWNYTFRNLWPCQTFWQQRQEEFQRK